MKTFKLCKVAKVKEIIEIITAIKIISRSYLPIVYVKSLTYNREMLEKSMSFKFISSSSGGIFLQKHSLVAKTVAS